MTASSTSTARVIQSLLRLLRGRPGRAVVGATWLGIGSDDGTPPSETYSVHRVPSHKRYWWRPAGSGCQAGGDDGGPVGYSGGRRSVTEPTVVPLVGDPERGGGPDPGRLGRRAHGGEQRGRQRDGQDHAHVQPRHDERELLRPE